MPLLKDRRPRDVVLYRIAMGDFRAPKTAGSRPSVQELDHFVVTQASVNASGTYDEAPEIMAQLRRGKEKPRRIPVTVDSDEVGDWLEQAYEVRRKTPEGKLVVWCHGDGETAKRIVGDAVVRIPCRSAPMRGDGTGWADRQPVDLVPLLKDPRKDKPRFEDPDPCRCPYAQNSDPKKGLTCRPRTEALFRLRLKEGIGGGVGFARFRSHGHRTADAIAVSIERIARLTGGLLAGVPLALCLERVTMGRPDGGRATHSVAHLELDAGQEEALELVRRYHQGRAAWQLEAQAVRGLLPAQAGAERVDEDIEVEDAEFAPAAAGEEGGEEE